MTTGYELTEYDLFELKAGELQSSVGSFTLTFDGTDWELLFSASGVAETVAETAAEAVFNVLDNY